MRLLHARDAHDGAGAPEREPGSDGGGDPRRDLGRHLPLHRYKNIVSAVRWAAEHEAAARLEV